MQIREKKRLQALGAEVVEVPGRDDRGYQQTDGDSRPKGIDSVLVEGGASLNYSVMEPGCEEVFRIYRGKNIRRRNWMKSLCGRIIGADSPQSAVQRLQARKSMIWRRHSVEYEEERGDAMFTGTTVSGKCEKVKHLGAE